MILFKPFIRLYGKCGSYALENLNEDYKQYNGDQNYHIVITLITLHDGDVSESAAADGAAHCRITENCRYGNRCV